MKKYMRRIFGCLMLTFFPLLLIVDRMLGFIVTGVQITFMQSCREIWREWLKLYWIDTGARTNDKEPHE